MTSLKLLNKSPVLGISESRSVLFLRVQVRSPCLGFWVPKMAPKSSNKEYLDPQGLVLSVGF